MSLEYMMTSSLFLYRYLYYVLRQNITFTYGPYILKKTPPPFKVDSSIPLLYYSITFSTLISPNIFSLLTPSSPVHGIWLIKMISYSTFYPHCPISFIQEPPLNADYFNQYHTDFRNKFLRPSIGCFSNF